MIVNLIVSILRILIPALFEASPDTYSVAAPQPELKKALADKVRATWGVVVLLILLPGCFTRTVYVPHGTPVKLRESIEAKIWVKVKDGEDIPSKMTIPEGWYALPVDEEGSDDGKK